MEALDPETAALLRRLDAMNRMLVTEPRFGAMETARAYSAAVFQAFAGPVDPSAVTRLEIRVGGGDGMRAARSYRPAGAGVASLPAVVFFHGGGWSVGDLDSYDELMRALCVLSGVQLISVDYRLAPEHPFPAGLDDAIAATRWIATHAGALGVDAGRIALMGDSAGGNLAACVCNQMIRDNDIPAIVGQFLIYPVIDVSASHTIYPSRMTFGDGDYLLGRDAIDASRDWYLKAGERPDDPRVSPLFADDPDRLPPTWVMIASHDPLRDEGRAYVERLKAAGVETHLEYIEGTIHAFLSFGVLDVSRRARRILAGAIRARLTG